MLQDQRALQVFRAMQSAGQLEVALEVGSGGLEDFEDRFPLRRHIGIITGVPKIAAGDATIEAGPRAEEE